MSTSFLSSGITACSTCLLSIPRSIRRYPGVAIGGLLCLAIMLMAVAAPQLSPFDPNEQDILATFLPPGGEHILGTDGFGRDVLSRLLWGARISVTVSVTSILLAALLGGAIGVVSGYVGETVDEIIMRIMDVLLSFPALILGLLVVALIGSDIWHQTWAIALTAVAPFARSARAPILTLKEQPFIEAGHALGFSHARILCRHLIPNVLPDLLVVGGLWMATAVRTEASLAFIGLGVPPPTATWGGMMRDGFDNILTAPWLTIWPGLVVLVFVVGLNLVGDSLGDAIGLRARDT